MTQHIRETCGYIHSSVRGGYIKGDPTKHISPKLFFTHGLQKNGDTKVQQIRSNNNLPNLSTWHYQL